MYRPLENFDAIALVQCIQKEHIATLLNTKSITVQSSSKMLLTDYQLIEYNIAICTIICTTFINSIIYSQKNPIIHVLKELCHQEARVWIE